MKRLTFPGLFCDIAMCTGVPSTRPCKDGPCSQRKTWERLRDIEDILGDEYDLNHLKELVQADREQMYMEPGVHINIQNGNDCFQSWWLRNRESTKEREQDG